MIEVLHFNASAHGGAALASERIHAAVSEVGVSSALWTPESSGERLGGRLRRAAGRQLTRLLRTENDIRHTPAFFPGSWRLGLNSEAAGLLHLHWMGNEALSVKQIGAIKGPVIWTLHDMWAFCGAEHVAYDQRWREGYRHDNRPEQERGFDLNRWVWARKVKHWKRPIQIVAPSRWMAQCVRDSALMKDWPVAHIPNPIDTKFWRPMPKQQAREHLGLPQDEKLILFGTFGETFAWHKGFDLLIEALKKLKEQRKGIQLLVLGQDKSSSKSGNLPLHAYFCGQINDQARLLLHYCAADVLVIPSRVDNLPNTGVEALACGTPVVAFNTGGLSDIVEHGKTGYLARAFDTGDFANGIYRILKNNAAEKFSSSARSKAIKEFSLPVVGAQYQLIYELAAKFK